LEEPCALIAQARFCEGEEYNLPQGKKAPFYSTSLPPIENILVPSFVYSKRK
jgi:hypothetical protein